MPFPPQKVIFKPWSHADLYAIIKDFPYPRKNGDEFSMKFKLVLYFPALPDLCQLVQLLRGHEDTTIWSYGLKAKYVKINEDLQLNQNTPKTYHRDKEIGEKIFRFHSHLKATGQRFRSADSKEMDQSLTIDTTWKTSGRIIQV